MLLNIKCICVNNYGLDKSVCINKIRDYNFDFNKIVDKCNSDEVGLKVWCFYRIVWDFYGIYLFLVVFILIIDILYSVKRYILGLWIDMVIFKDF